CLSDWSSDVCSSDLRPREPPPPEGDLLGAERLRRLAGGGEAHAFGGGLQPLQARADGDRRRRRRAAEVEHPPPRADGVREDAPRSEERRVGNECGSW